MKDAPAGKGVLHFEKIGQKTFVTEAFSKSPLKLLTPQNAGHTSWVYSSNFGGGFVGGDDISIDIEVKDGAEAVLLSQASTKVYRADKECSQTFHASVGESATFMNIPDPVVCFSGAKFRQKQKYELTKSSSLLLVDTLHCGREHSGEKWDFDSYFNQIEVSVDGKKVFLESLLLNAHAGDLRKRKSRFNALSLLYMTGPAFREEAAGLLHSLENSSLRIGEDLVLSASRHRDGLVMRLASSSTELLGSALKEALEFIPQRLGDDPWARKW